MTAQTSVIIPCYNGQAYLDEALETVRSQTRPAREVIVIDDGSRIPIQSPSAWDGRPLRIIRTPNQGLPSARNVGLSLATGSLVALLDVGDAWHPKKLETQEDALGATPGAVVSFTRCSQKPGWLPCPRFPYPAPDATTSEFWRALWQANFISPSSTLMRRDAIMSVGGFNRKMRYCEDWECWFRLLSKGPFV